jgi:phage shock protein PspC (stress-responsive transcriptional regulator)
VSVLSAAFPGILVYLILWLVVPRAPQESTNGIPERPTGP